MTSNQDLKLKIYELQKDITYLRELLKYNKIQIDDDYTRKKMEKDNIYKRTIPSSLSFMRRVCTECHQNLQLHKFSVIDRNKSVCKFMCCNCVIKLYKIK